MEFLRKAFPRHKFAAVNLDAKKTKRKISENEAESSSVVKKKQPKKALTAPAGTKSLYSFFSKQPKSLDQEEGVQDSSLNLSISIEQGKANESNDDEIIKVQSDDEEENTEILLRRKIHTSNSNKRILDDDDEEEEESSNSVTETLESDSIQ